MGLVDSRDGHKDKGVSPSVSTRLFMFPLSSLHSKSPANFSGITFQGSLYLFTFKKNSGISGILISCKLVSTVSAPDLLETHEPTRADHYIAASEQSSLTFTITDITPDLNWNNFYCLSITVKNYRSQ